MKNKISAILLAAMLIVSGSGCATRRAPVPTPRPQRQNFATPMTQKQNFATTAPGKITRVVEKNIAPPRQLTDLTSNVEAIMLEAQKGDWSKATGRLNNVRKDFDALKPMLQTTDASKKLANDMNGAITNLEKQVKAKNGFDTRVEANKITKYIYDAEDHYKTTTPVNVGRMGYHTRQIILEAEKGRWAEAKSNYDSISSLWSGLKGSLNSTYNTDSSRLSTEISNLSKSITGKNKTKVLTEARGLEKTLATVKSDFQKQSGLR